MITDRLDRCPFCPSKLKMFRGYMNCPNEEDHIPNKLWVFIEDEIMTAINIIYQEYQIHWHLVDNKRFVLIKKNDLSNIIWETDKLLDFPLTEEVIKSKIKTILVFQ